MCEAPKCEEKSFFKMQPICLSALVTFPPLLQANGAEFTAEVTAVIFHYLYVLQKKIETMMLSLWIILTK
jgi:hypothetical protein